LNDKLNLRRQYTRRLFGHQLRSSASPSRLLNVRIKLGRFGGEVERSARLERSILQKIYINQRLKHD
jgi:hypothetical protein